jgi:tetratricopeptide (TPR) repeat protein
MKTSEDLHILIANISQEEKRFFRNSIKGTRDNIYLQLFETIEKQKDYDEQKIKKKLLLSDKALGNAKYYLFKLIIKCLRRKHEDIISSFKARSLLDEIEILYMKGLHDQALKAIGRIRKLSTKGQNQLELTRAIQFETIIMVNRLSGIKLLNYFEGAHHSLNGIYQNALQLCDLHLVQQKVMYLSREFGFNRSKPDELELRKLESHVSLRTEPSAENINSYILFHTCLAVIAKLKFDHETEAFHLKKVLDIMQANFSEENQLFTLISAHYNYTLSLVFSGRYEEAIKELGNLKKRGSKAPFAKEKIRMHSLILKGYLYNFSNRYGEGIADMEKEMAEKELENYAGDLHYVLYHLAVLHFETGNYKKSKSYLNKLFELQNELPALVYTNARILMLMVHAELDEKTLLASRLSSAKRIGKLEKGHYQTGELALDIFTRLLKNPEKKVSMFKASIPLYEKLLEDPFEKNGTRFLNFLGWMKEGAKLRV